MGLCGKGGGGRTVFGDDGVSTFRWILVCSGGINDVWRLDGVHRGMFMYLKIRASFFRVLMLVSVEGRA